MNLQAHFLQTIQDYDILDISQKIIPIPMSLLDSARVYTSVLLESCKDYPYHNPDHTRGVFDRATYLAMSEGVE